MILTITSAHKPATDLGFLLHKHPDKFQSVDLSIGKAHVFYPVSSEDKTTVALLLDIDPIDMVRGSRNASGSGFSLGQYVNDRPYVASSFMSVALVKAFSTAMNGKCANKPELVDTVMPLEVEIAALPAPRGGEILIRKFFEPLGYQVNVTRQPLDDQFKAWGDSKYYTVNLKNTVTVKDLLSHLYVLIPALDNDKHYFVSQGEIEKLLEKGSTWLSDHPEREQITRRYLINLSSLTRQALDRLNEGEDEAGEEAEADSEEVKRKQTLHQQRLALVMDKLLASGADSVLDMGCGEGKLLKMLLKEKQFRRIAGMDVSYRELLKARDRLHWNEMAPKQKERIELFQGALTYRDKRLENFDAAAAVEVIEHMDENRLASFERVVFQYAVPGTVVITTPNADYNEKFEGLDAGTMRHTDHRFEWTRSEFESWAGRVAEKYNYTVEFFPVGEEQEKVGAPSQMGVFKHGN